MNTYCWQDIHLGLKATFERSFTAADIATFAALSGDRNPLHVDAGYARAQGFSGPVVFGLMVSSLYSTLVGMYLPGKYALLQGIDIHFNAPVFADELLTVEGEVSCLNEAFQRFEIRGRIRKAADRATVSRCTIRVGFHNQPPA